MLTPDGKTVLFVSNRDASVNHLFAVPLSALTEDPDDPTREERRAPRWRRATGRAGRARRGGGGGVAAGVQPMRVRSHQRDRHRRARHQPPRRATDARCEAWRIHFSARRRTVYSFRRRRSAAGGRGAGAVDAVRRLVRLPPPRPAAPGRTLRHQHGWQRPSPRG